MQPPHDGVTRTGMPGPSTSQPLRGLDAFAQSILTELLEDFRKQEGPAFLVITADVGVAQVRAEDARLFKDRKGVERGGRGEIVEQPQDGEAGRGNAEAGHVGPADRGRAAGRPVVGEAMRPSCRRPSPIRPGQN